MGTCYRAFVMDEFDWDYHNFDRQQVVNEVKAICPHAELKADLTGLMIFDLGKTSPDALFNKITCDSIYFEKENSCVIKDIFDIIRS